MKKEEKPAPPPVNEFVNEFASDIVTENHADTKVRLIKAKMCGRDMVCLADLIAAPFAKMTSEKLYEYLKLE